MKLLLTSALGILLAHGQAAPPHWYYMIEFPPPEVPHIPMAGVFVQLLAPANEATVCVSYTNANGPQTKCQDAQLDQGGMAVVMWLGVTPADYSVTAIDVTADGATSHVDNPVLGQDY